MAPVLDASCRQRASDALNEAVRSCLATATAGTRYIARHIFHDLAPSLQALGSAAWVQGGGTALPSEGGAAVASDDPVMRTVVDTVADYLRDLQRWLSGPYFFSKIVKTCADTILLAYVQHLAAQHDRVVDAAAAARRVEADAVILNEFTQEHRATLRLRKERDVEAFMRPMQLLAAVMGASSAQIVGELRVARATPECDRVVDALQELQVRAGVALRVCASGCPCVCVCVCGAARACACVRAFSELTHACSAWCARWTDRRPQPTAGRT